MFNTVLVAVDGSENSKKALNVACHLVKKEDNATLHILHIPESLSHDTVLVWGIGAIPMEASSKQVTAAGRKVVEGAKAEAQENGDFKIETHVEQGDPSRLILNKARDLGVEAIVLGSRGLGGFGGLIMGSVSHKVTHNAKSTVITVR
ncbi:universal stress protein [Pistricoccus aurantiacus]|uniref:Universal stress protein n=1 Tax=Pistricoccus aurantiacus TaxID=1883414 RepID=A0A5B8SVA9_9GAMM|nr:universal stress protein [Pistricoccus aurantiacus]QEA39415.1 universal stress protein [Pistricoccus aurantiacus]